VITAFVSLFILPEMLSGREIFDRAPRLGLTIWLLLPMLGLFASFTLLLDLAFGNTGASTFHAFAVFLDNVRMGHPLAGMNFVHVAAFSLVFDGTLMLLLGLVVAALRNHSARLRQRTMIDLVCTKSAIDPAVFVLPHQDAAAYFVPGRGGRIVISDGAMQVMQAEELQAVIAHEMGHKKARHGALLTVLQSMVPFVTFFPAARYCQSEIQSLIEMCADDSAAKKTSALALRAALQKANVFATAPVAALGIGNHVLERRIARAANQTWPIFELPLIALVLTSALNLAATITFS